MNAAGCSKSASKANPAAIFARSRRGKGQKTPRSTATGRLKSARSSSSAPGGGVRPLLNAASRSRYSINRFCAADGRPAAASAAGIACPSSSARATAAAPSDGAAPPRAALNSTTATTIHTRGTRRILLRIADCGLRRPTMRRALIIAATLLTTIALRAADDAGARWWAHVEALANDGMEGRNTGSAGHKRAADYVAAQFRSAALEPAGAGGGFIQPVAFDTRKIDESKSSLALVRDGADERLALGEDANISVRVDPAASLEAPLVFVGYGLRIPERGIDDFAGVDLHGAVVVHIAATPKSLPGPLHAPFGAARA